MLGRDKPVVLPLSYTLLMCGRLNEVKQAAETHPLQRGNSIIHGRRLLSRRYLFTVSLTAVTNVQKKSFSTVIEVNMV